jgi:hypothetical protein
MSKIDSSKLARNVRRLGHITIPGGGQVVVQGGYAYVGHMDPPHGTTILDVSNPADPKIVSQIELPDGNSHTHKVRVVGDLMFTNYEQFNRHFLRKGNALPEMRKRLQASLGRAPSDDELAAEAGVKASDIATLDAARERGYEDGGFCIYDISDRANPKRLCHKKTYGFGVHRFDVDENYAYMSTEMEGYVGNILVVYDYSDPTDPKEVSRWAMPGQHVAAGETPTGRGYSHRLHHAMRVGDEFWASCWHAGLRVIDASDIRNLKTIGTYDYHPPIPEPTHTVMPLEQLIDGRRIAVVLDEEHSGKAPGQLHGFMWTFDVTDLSDIRPLAIWDLSEMDSPYSRTPGGRFGAHQYREKLDSTLVYMTWFSGGLRIVDVADPATPQEVGFFIPEPVDGNASPQSNDVDVDDKGLIYLLDRFAGFDILEFTP